MAEAGGQTSEGSAGGPALPAPRTGAEEPPGPGPGPAAPRRPRLGPRPAAAPAPLVRERRGRLGALPPRGGAGAVGRGRPGLRLVPLLLPAELRAMWRGAVRRCRGAGRSAGRAAQRYPVLDGRIPAAHRPVFQENVRNSEAVIKR